MQSMRWQAALGVGLSAILLATTAGARTADLAAALALVPTEDARSQLELRRLLPRLDGADLVALCDQLEPRSASDDTPARFVLQALAAELSRGHLATQQRRFAEVIGQELAKNHDPEIKQLLIEQLGYVGQPAAVPAIARTLGDERLTAPAVEALVRIGGERAAQHLRLALPQTTGLPRQAVIYGLERLGDPRAIAALRTDARDADPATQAAARAALARFGQPPQQLAIAEKLLETDRYHGSQQLAELFEAARNMAARRQQAEAGRLLDQLESRLDELDEHEDAPDLTHWYCAALWTRAAAFGGDAIPQVVAAMQSENPIYAAAAKDIATSVQGADVASALLAALDQAEPELQVELIDVLVARGSADATPYLVGLLSAESADVRQAAARGLAAIGGRTAMNPLLAYAQDQPHEARVAEEALVLIRGRGVGARLAEELETAPATLKPVLLRVLGRRQAVDQLPAIVDELQTSEPRVRVAAMRALGDLGTLRQVPALIAALADAPERERGPAEEALTAIVRRAAEPAAGAQAIIDKLDPAKPDQYISLLNVLSYVGGEPAFKQLRQALDDEREAVREAAYRALGNWPDPAQRMALLEVAATAEDLKSHVFAMRAFADLFGQALDGDDPDREAHFRRALEVARRPEEKRLVISAVAQVADIDPVDALLELTADETFAQEAAAAVIALCEKTLPASWQQAGPALDQVIAAEIDPDLTARAQSVRARSAELEGYMADWQVAGPYSKDGIPFREILDTPFPPEPGVESDEPIAWALQPKNTNPARYWYLDLNQSVRCGNCAAYLRTFVNSPRARAVRAEAGSDDAIKVWINGTVVHANNVTRGAERGADTFTAQLNEGWNEILIKIVNGGGGFAACMRLRDPEGGALPDLEYSVQPPVAAHHSE